MPSPLRSRNLATGERTRDGRQQLDEGLGDAEQRLFDTVALDPLAMGQTGAESRLVPFDRRVEIAHGNGDVVYLGDHQALGRLASPHPATLGRAPRTQTDAP